MPYGIYNKSLQKWMLDKPVLRKGKVYSVAWTVHRVEPFLSLTEAERYIKLMPVEYSCIAISNIGRP